MPTVSNTSPLIWLSKTGKILLLKELFGEIIIPEQVYKEAIENGLAMGFSDALVIKECVNQGWIKVSRLTESELEYCRRILDQTSDIHLGEVQAMILARRMKALLLMDESVGREFARTWDIKVKGVLYIVTRAFRENKLNRSEAKETIHALVSNGFRIEPNLLSEILRALDQ